MFKGIVLSFLASLCCILIGCSYDENDLTGIEDIESVDSPNSEDQEIVLTGTTPYEFNSQFAFIGYSRAKLELENFVLTSDYATTKFEIIVNSIVKRTVTGKTVTITSKDLGTANSVTLKMTGASSGVWHVNAVSSTNATNPMTVDQCTDGVARIKNGTNKMPWNGGAKDWAINAQNAGFLIDQTPQVGAIMVIKPYYMNGQLQLPSGHVGVVTAVTNNPLKITIIAMNDTDGAGKWTTRTLTSTSNYVINCAGYIYYKLDKYTVPK